ncbi:MAG: hypothetical protein RSB37_00880 [Acetivibrio sp.]
MEDLSWIHSPALKGIHPKKLEAMASLVKNTEGKPIAQSIPFLMQTNKHLQGEGLVFTEEETALIMDILTRDMSVSEKEQITRMKTLFRQKSKSGL